MEINNNFEKVLFSAATANGDSEIVPSGVYLYKSWQSSGTFVATVTIYGSLDGATWKSLGTISTSGQILNDNNLYAYTKATISSYTSGSVTVRLLSA